MTSEFDQNPYCFPTISTSKMFFVLNDSNRCQFWSMLEQIFIFLGSQNHLNPPKTLFCSWNFCLQLWYLKSECGYFEGLLPLHRIIMFEGMWLKQHISHFSSYVNACEVECFLWYIDGYSDDNIENLNDGYVIDNILNWILWSRTLLSWWVWSFIMNIWFFWASINDLHGRVCKESEKIWRLVWTLIWLTWNQQL